MPFMFIAPLIASLLGTATSTATQISSANKQIAAQEEAQKQQELENQKIKTFQNLQNQQQQDYNNRQLLSEFKNGNINAAANPTATTFLAKLGGIKYFKNRVLGNGEYANRW